MVVTNELALRLLSTRRTWTDTRKLNTAVTALLLMEQDSAHSRAYWQGIKEGRYRIDSKLIADLYSILPKHLKIELFDTRAAARIDPKTFRSLFRPLYQDRSLTPEQRKKLLLNAVGPHVGPKNAEEYRDVIREMLWSRDRELVWNGLLKAGYLNYMSREDLKLIKRKAQSKAMGRENACSALTDLARRHKEIHPSVLEFLLEPSLSRIAYRISRKDREASGRVSGFFLLEALHQAGGPIAPGVRPRWPAYDKRYGRPRSRAKTRGSKRP